MVGVILTVHFHRYIIMGNYQNMDVVLSNMDRTIVYKKKNNIWAGVLTLLVGVICFTPVIVYQWPHGSVWPLLLLVSATIFFIVGLIKLFLRKEYFVSAENHQKLRKFEIDFHVTESDKLVRLCTSGELAEIGKLKRADVGGGLKLVVMATPDMLLCFSQVVQFVMFEYVEQTPMLHHGKEEAELLHRLR
jgi:hypothetical protein